MASEFSNDNDVLPTPADPQGQAALSLVESLIHGLVERKLLSVAEAVEIVETAREVQVDAHDALALASPVQGPVTLLQAISSSLKQDLADN